MRRLLSLIPLLLGAASVVVGVSLGAMAAGLEAPGLLAAAMALAAGLAAGASALKLSRADQRRPLLVASALAPLALLIAPYQPLPQAAIPLRLVAAALAFHVSWSLSRPTSNVTPGRYRWAWLVAIYIGSLLIGSGLLPQGSTPARAATLAWLLILLGASVVIQVGRLRAPEDLIQETTANLLLWISGAASVAAGAVSWLASPRSREGMACAAAGLLLAWGFYRASRSIRQGDTAFSGRSVLAAGGAMAVAASTPWIVGDPGPWPLSSLAVAALGIAWLIPPLRRLIRRALEQTPPRSGALLERAITDVAEDVRHAEGLAELGAALGPLERALPTGGIGLVCFDPDRTVLHMEGKVSIRDEGPGRPLHRLLSPPSGPRPLLASQVVDLAVRTAELRPASDLIETLSTDLIIPLPGGRDGALSGALLVGRPERGRLRGRRSAQLGRLAEGLGPRLRSAILLEGAAARTGELIREQLELDDRIERMAHIQERLEEENRLLRADRAGTSRSEVVGRSAVMKALLESIERTAKAGTHLLIEGESGTGRNLVARTVHEASARRRGPMVRFNSTGTPPEAHITALLGRADGDGGARPGLIELADGGSLVIEEIGSLALEAQSELIRTLASGEVARVGSAALRRVDLVIMGTTGRSSPLVQDREVILPELRDRLSALVLQVPQLRDRKSDVAELARLFLARTARRQGVEPLELSLGAAALLERYSWPGNVRQLRAVMEHVALTARGASVEVADLPSLGGLTDEQLPADGADPTLFEGTFEEIERRVISHVLASNQGNKADAARQLGLKRTTFNSRLKKLGLG